MSWGGGGGEETEGGRGRQRWRFRDRHFEALLKGKVKVSGAVLLLRDQLSSVFLFNSIQQSLQTTQGLCCKCHVLSAWPSAPSVD